MKILKNKKGIAALFLIILLLIPIYFFSKGTVPFNLGKNSSEVKIGVAVPVELLENNSLFFQGINMALEEINNSGGILGKKLEIVIEDDEMNVTKALGIAEKFSSDKTISGVIGHWTSDCTISTAQIYDTNNVILISPISTAASLTEQNYDMLFRNTTTDEKVAKALADYSNFKGYRNIAIYYDDTEYGRNFAEYIEKRCTDLRINVVDRHSYFLNKKEFESTYKKWDYMDVSAVFIAGTITDVRDIIYWIRDKDEDIPILGGDGFDIEKFKEYMGKNAENIMYTSFLNNKEENKKYNDFVSKFEGIYGRKPDYWAVKAYDSVQLFKLGMETAGTTDDSKKISDALKSIENISSVNGNCSFDENGDLIGDKIAIKYVVDGRYQYLFDY